jgi:hypothetical protein
MGLLFHPLDHFVDASRADFGGKQIGLEEVVEGAVAALGQQLEQLRVLFRVGLDDGDGLVRVGPGLGGLLGEAQQLLVLK